MRALALLGLLLLQESDIDALLNGLSDKSVSAREKAATALVELGEKAEAPVRQRMEAGSGPLKESCRRVLRRIELQRKLRELLPSLISIDLDANDRPLPEVVADLERQAGFPIRRDRLPTEPMTLQVRKTTAIQALDAIFEATGCSWKVEFGDDYDSVQKLYIPYGPRVAMVPGRKIEGKPPKKADAYLRHYRIDAGTTLTRSSGPKESAVFGTVDIAIKWLPGIRPEGPVDLLAGSIVDDKGRVIAELKPEGPSFAGFPRISPGGYSTHTARQIRIKYPEADARKISLLQVRARLGFVVERQWISFESPADCVGKSIEHEGRTVTLKEFQPAHGWMRLILDTTGQMNPVTDRLEPEEYRGTSLVEYIEVLHEDGRTTYPHTQGAQVEEGVYRKRMMCSAASKVKSIRMATRSYFAYDTLEFDLKDIPLPDRD